MCVCVPGGMLTGGGHVAAFPKQQEKPVLLYKIHLVHDS